MAANADSTKHTKGTKGTKALRHSFFVIFVLFFVSVVVPASAQSRLPRTADGKPNLQGFWKAESRAAADLRGRNVVEGGDIPYLPAAAKQRAANFAKRATDDPLSKCYMPGVPRVMYLDYPFQIFQTPAHVAIAFEFNQDYRLIYTNGSPHPDGIDFWMGDSRGRWDGDTLVVDVANNNGRTWFDQAGDFGSPTLHMTERYRLVDPDTIAYDVTFEDPATFSRPWTIHVPLHRQKGLTRLLEYQCEAEKEEANGAFERDPKTWYPSDAAGRAKAAEMVKGAPASPSQPPPNATGPIPRKADGKPDLEGYYTANAGGANYGLDKHPRDFLTPGTRGVIVDPNPDGRMPMQPWAEKEWESRSKPERGYDDPTAHCFMSAGVPRSMYTPSPYMFVQTPDYLVMLFERMSWRIIPLTPRKHLPDSVRLWQGDSVGHWAGDSLVIETTNMNGKTWLNEYGQIVSHAERIVERLTPVDATAVEYEATVTDPVVYTRPWTIAFPLRREKDELLEVACLEDNQDLQHLKDVRDKAREGKR
ncbi:MAG TPA: hypothetical protein VG871_04595 [Vicinamibacterales bacterium]|nr:hypothetical protein [Vicinamibacterales bacterium]